MDVFVEPAEWDNPDVERPIKLLEVTSTNYLGEDQVRGTRAVIDSETPCAFHFHLLLITRPGLTLYKTEKI